MRYKSLLLSIGVLVAAIAPAAANLIAPAGTDTSKATLSATCTGYTLKFQGRSFAPGETVSITWTITLQQGSTTYTFPGSTSYTAPTGGSPDPVITVTNSWGMTLCGNYSILNGDGVGRYDWTGVAPSSGGTVPSGASDFNILNAGATVGPCSCAPVVEECRKPRFWGRHSSNECNNTNITSQVIQAVGFLNVCGKTLDRTTLNTALSAEEALCVKGSSDDRTRLARQLTATALNCVMSGGGANCTGVSIGASFTDCNNACTANTDAAKIASCIDTLACFNRGGKKLASGMCQIGTCNGDGVTPCSNDSSCSGTGKDTDDRDECDKNDDDDDDTGEACVRTPNNCADQPLVNNNLGLSFHPVRGAGSDRTCREARKNKCTIFNCN